MDRRSLSGGCSVVLSVLVGCSSSSSEPGNSSTSASATSAEPARSSQEQQIVDVARQFLEAVIQGDSEAAISHMSPQAVEQMRSSEEAFSPPSWETATFQVGQVRMPNQSQAIVQCFFKEEKPSGTTQEEMCCMLKHVAGRWGVSGVAFQPFPQQAPILLDFEKPPQASPSQEHMAEFPTTPEGGDLPVVGDRYQTAVQPDAPLAR